MQLLESNTATVISIGNVSANRIKTYFSSPRVLDIYIHIYTYVYVYIYIYIVAKFGISRKRCKRG